MNRPRLLVLGLDGLPFSTAQNLCQQGHLPHLSRIVLTPHARAIQAELPELSPVNWTSFFTAAGPEEHGIQGFTSIDPRAYTLRMADFTQVRVPTIFDRLGDHGLSSRVINLPNTYPARRIRGMLVSGFVARDLDRAVYPGFLAGQLRSRGYILEADTARGGRDPKLLLDMLHIALQGRRAALELLWPDLAWDLFVFVLTETDRLGHFLFPALEDADHPWRGPCLEFLKAWDELVGQVLDMFQQLPEPKRLLVLADHGFTTLRMEVDLNAWLRRQGLLALDAPPADEWDCTGISSQSKAFALDPGRIYLHTSRFGRGAVAPDEAASLGRELRQRLLGLTWQGQTVLSEVLLPAADASSNPAGVDWDLLCVPRPGFSLRAKFDAEQIFSLAHRQGCHTPDNAFFHDSQGAALERVRDVGGEVLRYFNAAGRIIPA